MFKHALIQEVSYGSLLRRERKMVLDERWLRYGKGFDESTPALPGETGKLGEYDMVVLGDVPSERLGEEDQKRLAAYVSDRGGFLVVLAGKKAMPWSSGSTSSSG